MRQNDLKEKLIKKIRETNNPSILEEVSNLFELHEPANIYEVNPAQKRNLEEAQDDIKNNNVIDDAEANKEVDKWLEK